MKRSHKKIFSRILFISSFMIFMACSSLGDKKSNQMNKSFDKGTYGFDVEFFSKHNIPTIELRDSVTSASVLLVPGYQGRVMTSSTKGNEGNSFGWINYSYIESGETSQQFNPFGGEERLWLGPEGGPFSIYFKKGSEQTFPNWIVPAELDTREFEVIAQTEESATFRKDFTLENASGTGMKIGIERTVRIMSKEETGDILDLEFGDSISFVAYESKNTLINKGSSAWSNQSGFLSLWMLAMFNPSPRGVVFIPFKQGSEAELGKIVTDDYFGKVPADRLVAKDGMLYFRIDGKFRSKIGISPKRALPYCGSYDPDSQTLTLLWYSSPEKPSLYVNSKWGEQDDPLNGDVINSYNDGPVDDGSIMGPFYEIESSSPAALLQTGEKITHTQRIFHFTGNETQLNNITTKLFNVKLTEIANAF